VHILLNWNFIDITPHSWKVLSFFFSTDTWRGRTPLVLDSAFRSDPILFSFHTHTPHILMPRLYPLSQSLGSWWLSHSHSLPFWEAIKVFFFYIAINASFCCSRLPSLSTFFLIKHYCCVGIKISGPFDIEDKLLLLFLVLDEELLSQSSVAVCKYLCNKSHCLKAKALNNRTTTDTFIKLPDIS